MDCSVCHGCSEEQLKLCSQANMAPPKRNTCLLCQHTNAHTETFSSYSRESCLFPDFIIRAAVNFWLFLWLLCIVPLIRWTSSVIPLEPTGLLAPVVTRHKCCAAAEMNCLLHPALGGGTHKERLKDLHLFRLQESCLHEDSVAGFIFLVVTEREKPDFAQQCLPKDPGGGHKPLRGKCWLDNRDRKFHSEGSQTQQWPRGATNLYAGAAQSSAGQAVEASPALTQGINKGLPEVASNWNYSVIL